MASTSLDLDTYRDHCLSAGASSATVGRRLSGISSFFSYLTDTGVLAENPVTNVHRPSTDGLQKGGLDDAEILALVEAATRRGAKPAALISLLVLDGMKLNETLALNVPDVRLSRRSTTLSVRRRGEHHSIRLQPGSARAVAAYLGRRQRGPFFLSDSAVGRRPARLTRFGADYLIKRAASSAGIERPVSANSLRRSYIEAAERAGMPVAAIASQVGHQNVRETQRMLETTTRDPP